MEQIHKQETRVGKESKPRESRKEEEMRGINKSINPRVSQLKDNLLKDNLDLNWGARQPIMEFIQALERHIRGIKFGVKDGSVSKVYAYMEGSPYAMGWVAYADFRDNPEQTTLMYTVCSHAIHNGKYSGGEQMHMKMTTNFDVGIRNAKRYLRNLTTQEIALSDKDAVQRQFRKVNSSANETLENAMRNALPRHTGDTTNMESFMGELKHLVAIGYEWIDQSYGAKLVEFIKAYDEKQTSDKRTLDVIFVRAFNRAEQTMFETMEINNLHEWSGGIEGKVVTYDNTTLPVELAGKLSTLNMLGQGQYVEGVGLYHGDNMYYVVK